jgi:hypothetical protein
MCTPEPMVVSIPTRKGVKNIKIHWKPLPKNGVPDGLVELLREFLYEALVQESDAESKVDLLDNLTFLNDPVDTWEVD